MGGADCAAGGPDKDCDGETLDIVFKSSWEGTTKSSETCPASAVASVLEDDDGGAELDGGADEGGVDDGGAVGGADDGGVDDGGI